MAITKVQQVDAAQSGTTITLVLNGVTAGNFLSVQCSTYQAASTTSATISDSNGTFSDGSVPAPNENNWVFNYQQTAIWYQANAASGTHTVTVTSPVSEVGHATLCEWSGVATSTPLDQSASETTAKDTADTKTVTSGATTQADELVLVSLVISATGMTNSAISNPPTGYTSLYAQQNTSVDAGVQFSYKVVAATGTQSVTWTWDAGTGTAGSEGALATFKAGAGGGVNTTITPYVMIAGT